MSGELDKAWESASPELRKLGKETFSNAVSIAATMLSSAPPPPDAPPSGLSDALLRADRLDAKLAAEVDRRRKAAELAKLVFARALDIALKASLAAL